MSASTNVTPKTVNDQAFAVKRIACWNARDIYFECLDKNDEDENKCLEEQKAYHGSCLKAWVKHFDAKRRLGAQ